MKQPITIALDVMSGDLGYKAIIPAALKVMKSRSDIHLILVGQPEIILPLIENNEFYIQKRLHLHTATQVVDMDEHPKSALKNKKNSSMRVAIDLVKSGQAQACVSAGNTGALMATARFVLKMLPSIDRPAICTAIPSLFGHVHMLDLGANINSNEHHLYQFAIMGSILAQTVDNIDSPKVGLLNIGEEDIKGNEEVKAAAALLQQSDLNYIGFVEGNDIFLKELNVVVCDGFVGNVSLKTMEGASKLIANYLSQEFNKNILTKLAGLVVLPVLKNLKKRVDPRQYNGASLLGLQGVVIKSHGNADEFAFQNAIEIAIRQVEQQILEKIRHRFSTFQDQEQNQTTQ